MKILYPFNGIAAICFPVGLPKDGGTCEFATPECLKYCEAIRPNPIAEDVDKITSGLGILQHVTDPNYADYTFKYDTYKFITENEIDVVVERLKKEMEKMKKKILYWFKTGDCMEKHQDQIYNIISEIHGTTDYIQCGTTRNISLWNNVRRYLTGGYGRRAGKSPINPVRLALTQESMEETDSFGDRIPVFVTEEITSDFNSEDALLAIPDYKNNQINLYINRHFAGGCCGTRRSEFKRHRPDCSVCYKQKKKCFMEIPYSK